MSWLQATVSASPEEAQILELLLERLGAVSVTFGDAADEPLLEPDPGDHPLWRQTRVSALFADTLDAACLRSSLVEHLPGRILAGLRLEPIADQPWERVWLADFHPMRFGTRLWVCPRGQRPDSVDAVVVELDPGLAFGTGTHPTTALCLEWLDASQIAGKRVVDYGCGSGILAIAALRLGAAAVTAVDHDPQALEATRSNAATNGVAERLLISAAGQEPATPVDALLANILAEPLIRLSPTLTRLVAPQGQLVLSGILAEQAEAVTAAYRPSFDLRPPVLRDGWVRLDGVRREPRTGGAL